MGGSTPGANAKRRQTAGKRRARGRDVHIFYGSHEAGEPASYGGWF